MKSDLKPWISFWGFQKEGGLLLLFVWVIFTMLFLINKATLLVALFVYLGPSWSFFLQAKEDHEHHPVKFPEHVQRFVQSPPPLIRSV